MSGERDRFSTVVEEEWYAYVREDGGFFHCEVNRGGVCVWLRTDSPATPLPKQLTASTTTSASSMEVVG